MAAPAVLSWSPPRRRRFLVLTAASNLLKRAVTFDAIVVVAVAVLSLILSLTHPWSHAYVGNAQYGDAAYWDFAGESWARGYLNAKAPDIRPGYSVFLGIVYSLTSPDFRNAFVAQALLYAAGVGLVYLIGTRLGGRFVGILAAAFLALDPYIWEWTATSTTELLGSILNLGAVFAIVASFRSRRPAAWIALFGCLLACANIVRPVTLPFLVPALILLLLQRARASRRVVLAGVGVTATVLTLVPSVVYQLASTGDPGLSSNGAANLFAASSPKYGVWTPAIYDDVAAQLTGRGVPATGENINSEFLRLTVRNYVDFPGYQIARIGREFRDYAGFEGEFERPEQYIFYRPFVLASAAIAACVVVLATRPRFLVWTAPAALIVIGSAFKVPLATFAVAQVLGLGLGIAGLVVRRSRGLGLAAVAAYWGATGLAAIVTAGISGFFLNRLYTQVEPERALLLAVATAAVLMPPWAAGRQRARALSLDGLVRRLPRLATSMRAVPYVCSAVLVGAVAVGTIRLVLINVRPPEGAAFNAPTQQQLAALGQQLRLPLTPTYVDRPAFAATRATLVSGKLPSDARAYAMPGEITRFLWSLPDQDRTLFWFVFSDTTRPASLDRDLITSEALGSLQALDLANRMGLLIVVPTSAYFDATGDVSLQNVLAVRAFAPWNEQQQRFDVDTPLVFPLAIPLYDNARFQAATRSGTVAEAGAVRVATGDRLERALSLQADAVDGADSGGRAASITYPAVWLPPAARFQAWVALHPRLAGHAELGTVHVEIGARSGATVARVGSIELDPMRTPNTYLPLDIDLSQFQGERVDLSITVRAPVEAATPAEVLVGEPRIVVP